jgi:hypothetical protein
VRILVIAVVVAACTVDRAPAPQQPRTPPADRMPEDVLDQYDPNRELERPSGGDGLFGSPNVCGSWCNPCHDATKPPPPPGCLSLGCSGGAGGDPLLVALAAAFAVRPRRSRSRRRGR